MRAMIFSIPGSGTRFATKFLLEVLGWEQFAPRELAMKPIDSDAFTQFHVDVSAKRGTTCSKIASAVNEGLKVIIPIRSPVATCISRNKPGGETVSSMKKYWASLRSTIDGYDHVILPVEAPWFDHERLLGIVTKHINARVDQARLMAYAREWPKVGTLGVRYERFIYDQTGRTDLPGGKSIDLDHETAWYISLLAKFAGGKYLE